MRNHESAQEQQKADHLSAEELENMYGIKDFNKSMYKFKKNEGKKLKNVDKSLESYLQYLSKKYDFKKNELLETSYDSFHSKRDKRSILMHKYDKISIGKLMSIRSPKNKSAVSNKNSHKFLSSTLYPEQDIDISEIAPELDGIKNKNMKNSNSKHASSVLKQNFSTQGCVFFYSKLMAYVAIFIMNLSLSSGSFVKSF